MLTSFKDAKSRFQKVLSIFVYSVQPTSLPDLNVLADIGQVSSTSPGDDVFQHNEKCGMIQNNNVKVCILWYTLANDVNPMLTFILETVGNTSGYAGAHQRRESNTESYGQKGRTRAFW